jgi:hypothetical protein
MRRQRRILLFICLFLAELVVSFTVFQPTVPPSGEYFKAYMEWQEDPNPQTKEMMERILRVEREVRALDRLAFRISFGVFLALAMPTALVYAALSLRDMRRIKKDTETGRRGGRCQEPFSGTTANGSVT